MTGAAAISGVAGMSSIAAPAIAQNRRELIVVGPPRLMIGHNPVVSTYTGRPLSRYLNWVETATNGELVFATFEGDVPEDEDREFGIASEGEADAYFAGEYHWNLHHELFRLFGGAMPMGLSLEEFMGWFYHRGGEQSWNKLSERFNIKAFAATTLGYQSVGWFTEEVQSVGDFEGKVMDMPGVIGYIMSHMGAEADDYILEGPIVEALRNGTVYAAERSSPANDMPEGYHTGVRYFYPEVVHEPHTFSALGFNIDVWNALTANQQRTIQHVSMAHMSYAMAESTAENSRLLRELQEVHGIQIRRFPREVMLRICELSAQYVREELASTDEFSRQVVDSYISYRDEAMDWSEVTVAHFLENRRLPFSYTST